MPQIATILLIGNALRTLAVRLVSIEPAHMSSALPSAAMPPAGLEGFSSALPSAVMMEMSRIVSAEDSKLKCFTRDAIETTPNEGSLLEVSDATYTEVNVTFSEVLMDLSTVQKSRTRTRFECKKSQWKEFRDEFVTATRKLSAIENTWPNPGDDDDGWCTRTGTLSFSNVLINVATSGNIVYLYPVKDDNKAYCIGTEECWRLLGWSKRSEAVHLVRSDSFAYLSKCPCCF